METIENTKSDHRDKIATTMITWSLIAIVSLGGITLILRIYYPDNNAIDNVLNTLIPLFATWIGTILAYYFGKENFIAASKQYEKIINSLTPDLLDDVFVEQIMIEKATMIYKNIEDVKDKNIQEIVDFLNEVNKSRLPILDKNLPKYIIHKSTFLSALNKHTDPNIPLTFTQFISQNSAVAISFLTVKPKEKLETVIESMKGKAQIQDIFIVENDDTKGWLPDSLIKRYLMMG